MVFFFFFWCGLGGGRKLSIHSAIFRKLGTQNATLSTVIIVFNETFYRSAVWQSTQKVTFCNFKIENLKTLKKKRLIYFTLCPMGKRKIANLLLIINRTVKQSNVYGV